MVTIKEYLKLKPEFIHQIKEGKVYVDDSSDVPEGTSVKTGPKGGHYYDTESGKKADSNKKDKKDWKTELTKREEEDRDNLIPNAKKIYNFLRGEGVSHDDTINQLGEYAQWGEIPGITTPLGNGEPVDNKIRKLFGLPTKKEFPTGVYRKEPVQE